MIAGNGGMQIKEENIFHINDIAPIGPLHRNLNMNIVMVPTHKKKLDKKCPIHNGKCLILSAIFMVLFATYKWC